MQLEGRFANTNLPIDSARPKFNVNPDRLEGCLLGGAVGDALGLPFEGLKPDRAKRLFKGSLRYRFLFGRGMVSDDTEHALMTLESLMEADGDLECFRRSLAKRMRRWFLLLPGGVGLATAKACLKLCVGVSPKRSGVNSAGNGAAMRAAIIGAYFADNPEKRIQFVEASSLITHRDQRAIDGAQLIACASACAATNHEADFIDLAKEWNPRFADASEFPRGVSGFVLETVPAALGCWQRNPRDLRAAISESISLGGDSDTLAAIVGGIVGAATGPNGVPQDWLTGLIEWPRGMSFIQRVAKGERPSTFWPAVAIRNGMFLAVVLVHGFRRLVP